MKIQRIMLTASIATTIISMSLNASAMLPYKKPLVEQVNTLQEKLNAQPDDCVTKKLTLQEKLIDSCSTEIENLFLIKQINTSEVDRVHMMLHKQFEIIEKSLELTLKETVKVYRENLLYSINSCIHEKDFRIKLTQAIKLQGIESSPCESLLFANRVFKALSKNNEYAGYWQEILFTLNYDKEAEFTIIQEGSELLLQLKPCSGEMEHSDGTISSELISFKPFKLTQQNKKSLLEQESHFEIEQLNSNLELAQKEKEIIIISKTIDATKKIKEINILASDCDWQKLKMNFQVLVHWKKGMKK